jgi:hypothetical protein
MTVPAKSASATVERRAEVAPEGAQTATPVEPAHVSEQPELVRETAEPGAEEGAGAAVTVREPWDGYRQMSAKEVIARIADATPAELAAVKEAELEADLTAHIALTQKDSYKKRLRKHLTETRDHKRRVAARIKKLGGSTSTAKAPEKKFSRRAWTQV